VPIGRKTLRVDYGYRFTKEAFEFMGFDPHGRFVSVFHDDAGRARLLQRAGWRIWPITSRTSEELVSLASDLARADVAARDRARAA